MKKIFCAISFPVIFFELACSQEKGINYNIADHKEISEGIVFVPEVYLNLTGSILDSDKPVTEYATSEHDPQKDFQIHPIELHVDTQINESVSGLLYGIALQNEDAEWETEIEEARVKYKLSDSLSIGGGQFLNRFGFQNKSHVHMRNYINQNLQNSRLLSDGELITRGIEFDYILRNSLSINFATGKARLHDHGHENHEEGEHGNHEVHHLEADGINISKWITSADVKYFLDDNETLMLSASLAVGENEYGTNTWLYGAGIQKIWGGHDHGNGIEFCEGATKIKAETIGRNAGITHDDGDLDKVSDWGFSASLFYGLNEMTTLSVRQEYISQLEELELEDKHRTSFALTKNITNNILGRIQYDYIRNDSIQNEHALWLQFQIDIGGSHDSNSNHGH